MFPLFRQVQIATDFAMSVSARLAGVEPPAYDGNEQTLTELLKHIGKALSFIESLTPDQFEGSETREIVLRPGTPKEKKCLATFTCPTRVYRNFFHVTTAYAILRHNGLELGKGDFMGVY
jgi:hypothetical protein